MPRVVTPRGARFGAEARRAGGEAQRELLLVEDGLADEVCDGTSAVGMARMGRKAFDFTNLTALF